MSEPPNGSTPAAAATLSAPVPPAGGGQLPSPVFADPPSYLNDSLVDAERLLRYAAESGITVDDATRDHVLQARSAASSGWTEQTAANLIAALTTLAALVKPVSADSLKFCYDSSQVPTVRSYFKMAIWLAIFIVPFSVASFLVTAISTTVRADIAIGDALAVKFQTELGSSEQQAGANAAAAAANAAAATGANAAPAAAADATAAKRKKSPGTCEPADFLPGEPVPPPPNTNANEVITDLQQYASTIRSIDARARQLRWLVPNRESDPCYKIRNNPEALHQVFQLPAGLPNFAVAAQQRTQLYQDVRYFAQSLLEDESFFYGAFTTCILPVLYALLGTCAYLLRTFEQQMASRTYIPSEANSARFLIAAIGGGVVGLFNNNFTITAGATIPPLALAFLVGYAVDVFFTFLEGILQTFTRTPGGAPPAPAKANPSPQ
jgi:hypothetical protein